MKFVRCAILLAFLWTAQSSAFALVTFNWATVGDVGNAADPLTGLGAVSYSYNIAKTDVTNAQYATFLNTVDPTGANTLALYNSSMSLDATNGGITFNAGAASGAKYSVKSVMANRPVVYVTFLDAMRMSNWMQSGQGSGGTETGAYDLSLGGLQVHASNAAYWIPTQNEWYKAAYYQGNGTYNLYATGSALPSATGPTGNASSANYNGAVGNATDVGAYGGSASHYGTFDQTGNVWNWTEGVVSGTSREWRGGSWFGDGANLPSTSFTGSDPTNGAFNTGFRLASAVPEPSRFLLLAVGGVIALGRRRRDSRATTAGC